MFDRFAVAGKAAWALLGVAAALAVVFWIGWQFRVVFPPLVLAGAIVFILNPIVTALANRGVPRAGGTALSYLGFVGILVLAGFLIAPLVQTQGEELADEWPTIRDDLEERWDSFSERSKEDNWFVEIPSIDEIRDQLGGSTPQEVEAFDAAIAEAEDALNENERGGVATRLGDAAGAIRPQLEQEGGFTEQLDTVREIGTRIFEVGLIFILAPIIAFYLLVDLPHIGVIMRRLVPERARPQVFHVAHRLNHTIGGYFRGQLAVAMIVGAMVSLGLGILGLQFWIIVGMIAGLFNMIPLIGPWVGAIPGVAIAITTEDFGTALWVVAIMTIAQQIDNHFISPLVMQRTTSLHPAVVMLALLAGGTLGGFFGLLLAVPLTASIKVVVGHLWAFYVLEVPVDEVLAADDDTPPLEDTAILAPIEHYVEGDLGEHGGVGAHDDAGDDAGSDEPAATSIDR